MFIAYTFVHFNDDNIKVYLINEEILCILPRKKIDGEYLSHLRLVDDIVLLSSDADELRDRDMITELNKASRKNELKFNKMKTKIMSKHTRASQPHS